MTDHDFFPIRPSVREALQPTCPEDMDSIPEDETQWCSFWNCQCNWRMTKQLEISVYIHFFWWFLIENLGCFEMNCIPIPVRTPSSAREDIASFRSNDDTLQSSKGHQKAGCFFEGLAWPFFGHGISGHINWHNVRTYDNLRVWAREVFDVHGGKFHAELKGIGIHDGISWSYILTHVKYHRVHVISFIPNIQRIPIQTWINTSHETYHGFAQPPKGMYKEI